MSSEDSQGAVEKPGAPGKRKVATGVRVGLSVAAIVVLMLWILGVFHRGVIRPAKEAVPVESAAGLKTATLVMRTAPAVTEVVGTVQAEQIATITSRVVANVVEIPMSAGQTVENGQTLAVLDDRDLRRRLEQAKEAVRSAEATLDQARSDYKRDKPLFDQKVITPYDFEHTQTNLKTAEANVRGLREAEREAEVNLSYALIRSPFAGVVVDRLANVGDLAAPGKPLCTMYERGRLWLEASVPEDLLAGIHIGEVRTLRIDAREREMRGRVVEIVPSSDPATRTVLVRVHLDDTRGVVPGMFGRLLLPTAAQSVLVVPASAVTRAGQLTMVDVAAEGRVERRTVQLGRAMGDGFEVLSGLSAGDAVVLGGGKDGL